MAGVSFSGFGKLVIAVGLVAGAFGCLDESFGGNRAALLNRVSPAADQEVMAWGSVRLKVYVSTESGDPVPRGKVLWDVTSGQEIFLDDSVSWSDGGGGAGIRVEVGGVAGRATVRASLAETGASVDFTLVVTDGPVLLSVNPTSYSAGDTVIVTGTGLNLATEWTLGGALGVPFGVTATQVSLVVPPCLTPGQNAVVAHVGDVSSGPVNGTYVAGGNLIALNPGEFRSMPPSLLESCATFPAAGAAGASYLLAPQLVGGMPDDSLWYRIFKGAAPLPTGAYAGPPGGIAPDPALAFHDHLREVERELAEVQQSVPARAPLPPTPSPRLGDFENFQVCDTISCRKVRTVRAEARYVGERTVVFEDIESPAGGFDDADYESFGRLFDEELYSIGTAAFGAESDVDGNGKIFILLTPAVNRLTEKSSCNRSFISGFFYSVDISPAFVGDPRSNQAEIFYSIVPDPAGEVSCQFSVAQVRDQGPVTFIHEFQHMISFNQHTMLRGGLSESVWLNEGMSHLAEEIAADHFLALGDTSRFSNFAVANLINAYDYLTVPDGNGLIVTGGTGTLEQRGAAWLFLRWLVDHFGDDLPRRLTETNLVGVENVVAAVGEPLDKIVPEWFLANFVAGRQDTTLFTQMDGTRLSYRSWTLYRVFESFHSQSPARFQRPYPLVPVTLPVSSFDVAGVMWSGTGAYYSYDQPAGDPGFVVSFRRPDGVTQLPAPNGARLNVLRIR